MLSPHHPGCGDEDRRGARPGPSGPPRGLARRRGQQSRETGEEDHRHRRVAGRERAGERGRVRGRHRRARAVHHCAHREEHPELDSGGNAHEGHLPPPAATPGHRQGDHQRHHHARHVPGVGEDEGPDLEPAAAPPRGPRGGLVVPARAVGGQQQARRHEDGGGEGRTPDQHDRRACGPGLDRGHRDSWFGRPRVRRRSSISAS